jgi:hypothetical protein
MGAPEQAFRFDHITGHVGSQARATQRVSKQVTQHTIVLDDQNIDR